MFSSRIKRLASTTTVLNCSLGKATCISMDQILVKRTIEDKKYRKTKIICTMGPSCSSVDTIVEMIDAGMSVARLNFSHGDHETHLEMVNKIREACRLRDNCHVGIMLDTKGPEIRTGLLRNSKTINLVADQLLKITTDYSYLGDENCIACSYSLLPETVKIGSEILIADGSISCEVLDVGSDFVMVKVRNSTTIGERKNMNLPGCKINIPVVGEKDKNDIVNFGVKHKLDFIALSFVQHADDIKLVRELIGNESNMKIIAKIENLEGLLSFEGICNEADGIMVARGDLGMEIPPEKVFLAQKNMIAKCNCFGKPVITATQMLESMIKNPRPTRAEVTDVANAVLDGTDCVMLSGETASGLFPIEAVNVMARVCVEAEACIDYPALYSALHFAIPKPVSTTEAIACAAVETAEDTNSALILVLTQTGATAKFVCKYRPQQIVLACTANEEIARSLQFVRGCICVNLSSLDSADKVISFALNEAKNMGLVSSGQTIIAIHGVRGSFAGGSNLIKVVECP